MKKERAGSTAFIPTVARVLESRSPAEGRLVTDPFAEHLLSPGIRILLRSGLFRRLFVLPFEREVPGLIGGFVCRTRYIDDVVTHTIRSGLEQVVVLGAGLDTRAFRIPGAGGVKFFEIDLGEVQEMKRRRLGRMLARIPPHVSFIPLDLTRDSPEQALAASGFMRDKPALFVMEGVIQYLPAEAVSRIFTGVGRSAPGSQLVFTYILREVTEGRSGIPGARSLKARLPLVFGLDPGEVRAYLDRFHIDLVEDVGAEEYQERYLEPAGRDLAVTRAERCVRAMVR